MKLWERSVSIRIGLPNLKIRQDHGKKGLHLYLKVSHGRTVLVFWTSLMCLQDVIGLCFVLWQSIVKVNTPHLTTVNNDQAVKFEYNVQVGGLSRRLQIIILKSHSNLFPYRSLHTWVSIVGGYTLLIDDFAQGYLLSWKLFYRPCDAMQIALRLLQFSRYWLPFPTARKSSSLYSL